jgi:hypothetical protein
MGKGRATARTKTIAGEKMNYKEMAAKIAADRAASYWLKAAVMAANQRDPVDALRDAEILLAFCNARLAIEARE